MKAHILAITPLAQDGLTNDGLLSSDKNKCRQNDGDNILRWLSFFLISICAFYMATARSTTAADVPVAQNMGSNFSFDPLLTTPKNLIDTPAQKLPNDQHAATCADTPINTPIDGLTLMQAVTLALCHNPRSRQAWIGAQTYAARVGIARSAYFPTITASASRARTEQKTSNSNNSWSGTTVDKFTSNKKNISLNAVLFDFGARMANVEEAQQMLIAAMANQDAILQKLFQETVQVYDDALIAQANFYTSQTAKQDAEKILKATQARQAHGIGDPTDIFNAQANLARTARDEIKAKNTITIAMGVLANMMGLDARASFSLAPFQQRGLPDESMRQAQLLMHEAKDIHPSITQARAELSAAQAKVKSITAAGLPSLSAYAGRYINGQPDTQATSLQSYETVYGLTLSIPLFEGFERVYKIKEARTLAAARKINLEDAELKVNMDIWRSFQELKTAYSDLIATDMVLRGADIVVKATAARYQRGASDVMEWIRARASLYSAEQDHTRAKADWRTNYLKFLASLGKVGFWAVNTTSEN